MKIGRSMEICVDLRKCQMCDKSVLHVSPAVESRISKALLKHQFRCLDVALLT